MKNYKFKKTDGGPISKSDAEKWIENYKKKHPEGPWGFFFGEDIILKVVNQSEAVGFRVYLAYDENGRLQPILLGAREDGSNIWPSEEGKDGNGGGTAGDASIPCPPYCP